MYQQQGDVLIVRSDGPIPSDAKPKKGLVLAEGEATGHAHRVVCPPGVSAEMLELGTKIFLRILGGNARVVHEEHKEQLIAPGDYEVRRVQEYDHFAEEARSVRD